MIVKLISLFCCQIGQHLETEILSWIEYLETTFYSRIDDRKKLSHSKDILVESIWSNAQIK